jgi:hypothetical protein
MSLPDPFPEVKVSEDYNPAIRLYGNRFFKDQTVLEYLSEFLAVIFSGKRIGDGQVFESPLPSLTDIRKWSSLTKTKLCYRPPIKLNLKLFAFLSCSRVDSRDEIHIAHYKKLVDKIENSIKTSNRNVEEIRDWLEDFLRCFQGVGFNRTWCAQTFYPVSASLVTQETIWNKTVARNSNIKNWDSATKRFKKFYSTTRRIFLARGGELLYLQLCNVFATDQTKVSSFAEIMNLGTEESDLAKLHHSLQDGLQKLNGNDMDAFNRLVDYIELLDKDTHDQTNKESEYLTCEWCPRDSWQEAYLFAVEINRLLAASLDPVERLDLLMIGCSLQVMRSLCAQSVRYAENFHPAGNGGMLGYAWIFSSSGLSSRQQRITSHQNLLASQGLIQKALRHDALKENAARHPDPRKTVERLYREADDRYGHKLLLSLGKKLGIIAPRTGPGARFIMTDKVLRYMVLVLLKPGERCPYDEFQRRLYHHYGIAVEGEELTDAVLWSNLPANSSMQPQDGSWLAEMLRAGAFLNELSDACSIVRNTFG